MTPRNPTNSDLLQEIKSMQTAIIKIDGRVETLEIAKIASDASNAAIEKYKQDRLRSREDKSRMQILQALLPFVVALTALIYAIITYFGRTH